jgi:hypothetical protein
MVFRAKIDYPNSITNLKQIDYKQINSSQKAKAGTKKNKITTSIYFLNQK